MVEHFGQGNAKHVGNPHAAGLEMSKTQSPGTERDAVKVVRLSDRLPAIHYDMYPSKHHLWSRNSRASEKTLGSSTETLQCVC